MLLLPGATGRPELTGPLRGDERVVVLLLHGGAEHGTDLVTWASHAVLRMVPFQWEVARAGRRHTGLAAVRLKNSVRGWNGDGNSPLGDARWALGEVRRRAPGAAVVLAGHSMGGRVALALAADPGVVAVAALAPWVVELPPPTQARFLLMHGDGDRVTDPHRTADLAERLRGRGDEVNLRIVEGENHPMLRHPGAWHRAVADLAVAVLRER